MAEAALLGGEVAVRRWVAGSGQSGLRVALFLLAPFVLVLLVSPWLPDWLRIVPQEWSAPFVGWINAAVEFLRTEELFGLLTFRDMTRAIANLIDYPLDFVEAVLVAGFSDSVPGLPWIAVTGLAVVLGWYLQGRRLGIIAGICFAYMAIFGKWELSMVTLSVVLVAAPIAGAIGAALGIVAYKKAWFEKLLWPILNVMQALPHFSYMIPVAIFIGIGHKAGTIATIIFRFSGDVAPDHPRPQGRVSGGARGRRHGRLHESANAVEGRTAGGAADADGRRQPGHHAVPGDGRAGVLRRRQGPWPRPPEPAALPVDRPGAGDRRRDRVHGDHPGPAEPGLGGKRAGARPGRAVPRPASVHRRRRCRRRYILYPGGVRSGVASAAEVVVDHDGAGMGCADRRNRRLPPSTIWSWSRTRCWSTS